MDALCQRSSVLAELMLMIDALLRGNLQMLLVDVNNHATQCAYAARSPELYPPANTRDLAKEAHFEATLILKFRST